MLNKVQEVAVLHVENVAISMYFHLVSSGHLQKEHWLFMTGGERISSDIQL
jgi:hypothetical protein